MIRFAALAAASALALIAAPAFAQQADASVTITFQTTAQTGRVLVALYDSADAYGADRSVAQAAVDASGQVVAAFPNLPAGAYAVKAFHDLNGDGRMNTNPFGMPVEPYAFSNNAVGNMGPARWADARFTVSGATAQTIAFR